MTLLVASPVDEALERIMDAASAPVDAQREFLDAIEDDWFAFMAAHEEAMRRSVPSVTDIQSTLRKITHAQERGDLAAQLIQEGYLAGMRARMI